MESWRTSPIIAHVSASVKLDSATITLAADRKPRHNVNTTSQTVDGGDIGCLLAPRVILNTYRLGAPALEDMHMSHHECDQDLMSDAPHHRLPTSSEVASLENEVAAHSKTERPDVAEMLSDLIAAFPDAFRTLDRPEIKRPPEKLVVMLIATKAFFSLRACD